MKVFSKILLLLFVFTLTACSNNQSVSSSSSSTSDSKPSSSVSISSSDDTSLTENGLTKEENSTLETQKNQFLALSEKDKALALESGTVYCKKFVHLDFEEMFATELIDVAGTEQYKAWVAEQTANDECADIYSFCEKFSLSYDKLKAHITNNHLEDTYPLDKIKVRYEYFLS